MKFGTEASMHAKNSLLDDSTDRHVIKTLAEFSPKWYGVAPFTFIIEPIGAIDSLALMITSQEVELVWVLYLKRQQKYNHFNRLLASVNVITNEEVVFGFWWVTSIIKNTKKIGILTMNITHNIKSLSKINLQINHHCLFFEYFLGLLNKPLNSSFRKFDELTQILRLNLNKLSNDCINCKVFFNLSARLQPISHADLHSRPI